MKGGDRVISPASAQTPGTTPAHPLESSILLPSITAVVLNGFFHGASRDTSAAVHAARQADAHSHPPARCRRSCHGVLALCRTRLNRHTSQPRHRVRLFCIPPRTSRIFV
ncbi:hypothetical protein CBP34_04470 [Acidovorax carolinensis]|uniref:Uncharacterized protein n=1 Tax=Acidovorax carolinensis TaxID=553814 RepID=A0A240U130_9BURK|nr:hypothetical protein CBP34_04470 [Acidovorax carolinensis]